MASQRISDLTAYTTTLNTDVLPIVDVTTPQTKKITVNNLFKLPAGTSALTPLQYTSGTNLTNAAAGATEFDGVNFYQTIDTSSGRGAIPVEQYFHLTGNGGTITTIGNFFGANSNIALVASAYYEIELVMFYKTTASTAAALTWTLTNSATPTLQNITYEMSPITAMIAPPGTATMLAGQVIGDQTATKTIVTGTLTASQSFYTRMRIFLQNGTGTSLKIQATTTPGIIPQNGSWWRCIRRSPNNIGTFAA